MTNFKTIVLMPIGPSCQVNWIIDTVESIYFYMNSSTTKIIIVDDSQMSKGTIIKDKYQNIDLLINKQHNGKNAGLYYSLSDGFRYAIENYNFKVLLRMDTDALIINSGADDQAITYFNRYSNVGILGSYKYGYDGRIRNYAWAKKQLILESTILSLIKGFYRLQGTILLHNLVLKAKKNGYILGEHCMGGVCFYSYEAIRALYKNKYLPISSIFWSSLQEDMIFALLIKSIGYDMADFVIGNDPLGVKWIGLPDKPSKLRADKKIIHSTKLYKDMSENDIRKYFREYRLTK